MRGPRKLLNTGFGLALLLAIAYGIYAFATAPVRVRQACLELRPGTPLAALRAFADKHGLTAPRQETGNLYLVEKKTFGRWGCHVVVENGRVSSASYIFTD